MKKVLIGLPLLMVGCVSFEEAEAAVSKGIEVASGMGPQGQLVAAGGGIALAAYKFFKGRSDFKQLVKGVQDAKGVMSKDHLDKFHGKLEENLPKSVKKLIGKVKG